MESPEAVPRGNRSNRGNRDNGCDGSPGAGIGEVQN